jgi:hypothetical protein
LQGSDPQVTLSHVECSRRALALDLAVPPNAFHVSLN